MGCRIKHDFQASLKLERPDLWEVGSSYFPQKSNYVENEECKK